MGSLGTLIFSLHKAPQRIIKELEGLRRDFFWVGNQAEKRIPWVKWEKVLIDKDKGGLGIRSLETLNKVLLAKWCWRYKK